MANHTCHGCGKMQTSSGMKKCPRCGRILCDSCGGGRYTCKDSPKGTPGCGGQLQSPSGGVFK
jgi:hypothetical protein